LIEKGKVDVDCKLLGFPAIYNAAHQANIEIIKLFLSVGVKVNVKDVSGVNALRYAI
jgi:hypothetical protein